MSTEDHAPEPHSRRPLLCRVCRGRIACEYENGQTISIRHMAEGEVR